ncbi:MAG: class I SAM-dependent methyltransferase [Pseudobutyrivibrio sp.]|nr:class I SAM-dependent methyltransferase [Pseudobutyrivibrio sp.]
MIKLSPRLKLIYDMVPACDTVADVGCDHGYLFLSLLENGVAKKAIAMDVNKGPLELAKKNASEAGLISNVQFRLSNGFAALTPGEADVICLCGMGGVLMQRILDAGKTVAKEATCLVVEPQSEYRQFREFISKEHFCIIDEELCTEENKIYPIMKIKYDPSFKEEYSDLELEYGPIILKKRPELFARLLDKNYNEYSKILSRLEKGEKSSQICERIRELKDLLSLVEQARN